MFGQSNLGVNASNVIIQLSAQSDPASQLSNTNVSTRFASASVSNMYSNSAQPPGAVASSIDDQTDREVESIIINDQTAGDDDNSMPELPAE